MKVIYRYLSPPDRCSYLPEETSQLEYLRVAGLSADEYSELMLRGWRRFGRNLFRPRCTACRACRSLRIDPSRFRSDRSQRRAWRANEGTIHLEIGEPRVDAERMDLYDRFHRRQELAKGWNAHEPGDVDGFRDSFLDNPVPTEEWRYRVDGRLVGLGYVDVLPIGLSAIYFVHDPELRVRSLGTFNILSLLAEADRRGLGHVYLGYLVSGCGSLEYKARFRPHETLESGGRWIASEDCPDARGITEDEQG